ncbi:hypothetical protein F5878DRAFT_629557 [Lentinula raphanica]|uniref:Uncharacterized protein n=1 Tax=Lentinula raphanica TaxID=153919 RepID=A0AA38P247_9AGAR|nr:hypothetical protein F5878DRAFT_629557 [Lentinula raphanica]
MPIFDSHLLSMQSTLTLHRHPSPAKHPSSVEHPSPAEHPSPSGITYRFIGSNEIARALVQSNHTFMEEIKQWSKDAVENRVFGSIGITAQHDDTSNVEPIHPPFSWSWQVTTVGAALIINKDSRTLHSMAFTAEAADMPLDTYWVVPTPVNMRISFGIDGAVVRFPDDSDDPSSIPLPSDPIGQLRYFKIDAIPKDLELRDVYREMDERHRMAERRRMAMS